MTERMIEVPFSMAGLLGIEEEHHFASDEVPEGKRCYLKEVRIPAGRRITSHAHDFEHFSVLVSGDAELRKGDAVRPLSGYACIRIEAGVAHEVTALTDVIWLCIHAEDCRDPAEIDRSILKG